jgi:hypothetical protein
VVQASIDEALELDEEPVRSIGRQIQVEQLDRDEPIALGIEGAKDRTEGARTDLMQYLEGSKRVRRREAGSVRMQGTTPLEGGIIVTRLFVRVYKYSSRCRAHEAAALTGSGAA